MLWLSSWAVCQVTKLMKSFTLSLFITYFSYHTWEVLNMVCSSSNYVYVTARMMIWSVSYNFSWRTLVVKWLLAPTNLVSLARHEAAIATVWCKGPPPTNYCYWTHTCLVSKFPSDQSLGHGIWIACSWEPQTLQRAPEPMCNMIYAIAPPR